ncbi:recombination mediator RecR [Rubinisphaera italica]|uniref:Recombination protein RecR n=1 Tax=Rubinisphaera italica TaxID=2527969 RepID=A0A5C5XFE3_9PLAN|nr:recombination mediator RecR [Rubinisphaera italica]TWT61777.1 Recombination protein RecR [Rubinisphaera italica]
MDEQTHPYGPSVARLIEEFALMPGIGRKSAERLAQYVVNMKKSSAASLIQAIDSVKRSIRRCEVCHALTEKELCDICSDPRRDRTLVCVVEQPKDVISLEASGAFPGTFHVLHGSLSPLNGIGPEKLTINSLLKRIEADGVTELVMATNPTLEGDGTALYISNLLDNRGVRITRLARGIASGSVLEFANKEMLADALRGRQAF